MPSENKKKLLNVENLINSGAFKNKITGNKLLEKIQNIKKNDEEKLFKIYDRAYKNCLSSINNCIEAMGTKTIFEVDLFQFGYDNYSSLECILYIRINLEESNFTTYILNDNSILISWEHL